MSNEIKVFIIAAVIFIGLGSLLFLFGNPQPKPEGASVDANSLVRSNSHMTGATTAKVTLVEFGDFQCPACKSYAPVIKQVIAQYRDNPNFNFVFRNFPLAQHLNAKKAAAAAEAAGEQGKYWEMYEALYDKQSEWETSQDPIPAFTVYAASLGLNVEEFKKAITEDRFTQIINTDTNDGLKLQVNSTPTFFINGQKLAAPQAKVESFVSLIEQALNQPDTQTATSTEAAPTTTPETVTTTPATTTN